MANVKDHYSEVLAEVYSWMLGGFEAGIKKNQDFFKKHQVSPIKSGIAVDLGAGCGFQSIPLAQAGFSVTAIDLDAKLLDELKENQRDYKIITIVDDLSNFDIHIQAQAELFVCMTDTILHLESKQVIQNLLSKIYTNLGVDGKFVMTFRDLSYELSELDRFIAVKSDENTIFTCFLEYEEKTVKVHDIIYKKSKGDWELKKSFYRKLRISKDWIISNLQTTGFSKVHQETVNGLVTIIATK